MRPTGRLPCSGFVAPKTNKITRVYAGCSTVAGFFTPKDTP